MANLSVFENFFKPEVRKSGQDLVDKEGLHLSNTSDTQIQAYARGSTSYKVTFSAQSISDETFYADCSCSAAAKGNLCKHMWAALLMVEQKYPDFLDSKNNIEKASSEKATASALRTQQMKERQSDYRKLQYQKQKLKAQKIKLAKKNGAAQKSFPTNVQNALYFFSENGFDLTDDLNETSLSTAWKKLHRVFHPDVGGTHEESARLNKNFEILEGYLRVLRSREP